MKLVSILLLLTLAGSACAGPQTKAADTTKQELINIMKTVNFYPIQKRDDTLFCRTFYEDFKHQTNIEYIQPIVKADTYDDPKLKPYRDKCPNLDFRVSYWTSGKVDLSHLPKEELQKLGTPSYGIGHYQLYKVGINKNVNDSQEFVFYHEGSRTEDRRLPVGGPEIVKEIISPEARSYHMFDLNSCRLTDLVHFNQGGSAKWTRNGVIHYKGKNAIYVLRSAGKEQPNYRSLALMMYDTDKKRIVTPCMLGYPLKLPRTLEGGK